jgi:hypothetical protein
MCAACSRRALIVGSISTLVSSRTASYAIDGSRVACVSGSPRPNYNDMTSKSGDPAFDRALIAELKRIITVIPVDPGFKFVNAKNAGATPETIVNGTKGTVLIGLRLVNELLKPSQGGITVACVLAHECGHIFQFFSADQYYARLSGPTERLRELHADVLAGYYLAKKMGSDPSDMRDVLKAFIDFGAYENASPDDHGSPGQRCAALDKGYTLSLNGKPFEDSAREGASYVRGL